MKNKRQIKFRCWDKRDKKMITKNFSILGHNGAPHDTIGHLARNHTREDIFSRK